MHRAELQVSALQLPISPRMPTSSALPRNWERYALLRWHQEATSLLTLTRSMGEELMSPSTRHRWLWTASAVVAQRRAGRLGRDRGQYCGTWRFDKLLEQLTAVGVSAPSAADSRACGMLRLRQNPYRSRTRCRFRADADAEALTAAAVSGGDHVAHVATEPALDLMADS